MKTEEPNSFSRIPACQGFALVEFLGVLAIITIIAALVVPKVFKRLDRGAWSKEVNDMSAISNALTLQILRDYSIPTDTNWGRAVANWTIRSASQVLTNNRGYARLFFYDQGGWQRHRSRTRHR